MPSRVGPMPDGKKALARELRSLDCSASSPGPAVDVVGDLLRPSCLLLPPGCSAEPVCLHGGGELLAGHSAADRVPPPAGRWPAGRTGPVVSAAALPWAARSSPGRSDSSRSQGAGPVGRGRAGRPGAWSSRSSASSPPAVSSCRAAASSVAAPRCCGSLTSVWVWGGEAAKDRLCRRRRWRMQGSSGCSGGAVRDADAVTRGLTLDAADDEDVPSLVELGWRSELYPTRRLRQFR